MGEAWESEGKENLTGNKKSSSRQLLLIWKFSARTSTGVYLPAGQGEGGASSAFLSCISLASKWTLGLLRNVPGQGSTYKGKEGREGVVFFLFSEWGWSFPSMEHKLVKGTQGEALQVPKGRKRKKKNKNKQTSHLLGQWKIRKLERKAGKQPGGGWSKQPVLK